MYLFFFLCAILFANHCHSEWVDIVMRQRQWWHSSRCCCCHCRRRWRRRWQEYDFLTPHATIFQSIRTLGYWHVGDVAVVLYTQSKRKLTSARVHFRLDWKQCKYLLTAYIKLIMCRSAHRILDESDITYAFFSHYDASLRIRDGETEREIERQRNRDNVWVCVCVFFFWVCFGLVWFVMLRVRSR